MKAQWIFLTIVGLGFLYTIGHVIYQGTLEQPSYDVLKKTDDYEIRRYDAMIIAEVDSEAIDEFGKSPNDEFMQVAGYIFGENKPKDGSEKQKIAMTAPVIDTSQDRSRTISFVLPSKWSLDTLPEPTNDNVRIRKLDPRVVAVRTSWGRWSDKKFKLELAKLKHSLTSDDIKYTNQTALAYYDPPSAPWFIRKTDIMIELDIEVEQDLLDEKIPENAEVATLAGGCFWCIEAPYDNEEGVYAAISGYADGDKEDAKYELVASGQTDHKEAVQIYYDPAQITYEQILEIFWRQIDPTDDGGQFADRGPQYRTAIFYHSEEQREIAERTRDELADSGKFQDEIATEVLPFTTFFKAEEKHQNFAQKQAAYYKRYKYGSGRGDFIDKNWSDS